MIYTEKSHKQALARSLKRVMDDDCLSASSSAGFVAGKYQVFVKVMKFDKKLLKEDPESGGLLAYKSHKRKPARKLR